MLVFFVEVRVTTSPAWSRLYSRSSGEEPWSWICLALSSGLRTSMTWRPIALPVTKVGDESGTIHCGDGDPVIMSDAICCSTSSPTFFLFFSGSISLLCWRLAAVCAAEYVLLY